MSIKQLFTIIAAMLVTTWASAQIKMPAPSPTFELKGTVGLSEVKVVYSRPSARDRVVFGDLVRFGEVWRTGANASTKISFSQDVTVEGNAVPAGEYALYTIPGEEEFTIILSKNLTWWGALGYDPSEDLVRFKVPTKHPSSHYETFTISFSDFTRNSARLNMKWEKTKAIFTITHETDDLVMADIKDQVIDNTPSNAGVYFQAASYYYETDRDARQALEWVNKALEGQKQYWVVHLKAKLLVRLGYKEDAITVAKESIELAKKGKNPDYVRLNEKLIASLK